MNDADLKKRIAQLVDSVSKFRLWATLPDEFLSFVWQMESNPTEENLAKLESFELELIKHLLARIDAYRSAVPQQAQPEPRPEHFVVSNNLIN